MANKKLRNLRNLGNLGNIIPSFLIFELLILPYSQNRKLGFKDLGEKFPKFRRFTRFLSFYAGHYVYIYLNRKIYSLTHELLFLCSTYWTFLPGFPLYIKTLLPFLVKTWYLLCNVNLIIQNFYWHDKNVSTDREKIDRL